VCEGFRASRGEGPGEGGGEGGREGGRLGVKGKQTGGCAK
jgi:hypothetical protein